MTVINKKQGAVKSSEVIYETALPSMSVEERESLTKFFDSLTNNNYDAIAKDFFTLTSSGQVSWNAGTNTILIPTGVKVRVTLFELYSFFSPTHSIVLEIVGTPNTSYGNALMSAQGTTIKLENNETLSFSVTHSQMGTLSSGTLTLSPTITVSTSETLDQSQARNPIDDIAFVVPVAHCVELTSAETSETRTNLVWTPQKTVWEESKTAYIGSAYSTSQDVSAGLIVKIHFPDNSFSTAPTQGDIDSIIGIGWQLCDGSEITNPNSPFVGTFTPNINGNNAYERGVQSDSLVLGTVTGQNEIALTGIENPPHGHNLSSTGNHRHQSPVNLPLIGALLRRTVAGELKCVMFPAANANQTRVTGTTSTPISDNNAGAHTHTTATSGSGAAHNNEPSYFRVIYLLRIL